MYGRSRPVLQLAAPPLEHWVARHAMSPGTSGSVGACMFGMPGKPLSFGTYKMDRLATFMALFGLGHGQPLQPRARARNVPTAATKATTLHLNFPQGQGATSVLLNIVPTFRVVGWVLTHEIGCVPQNWGKLG